MRPQDWDGEMHFFSKSLMFPPLKLTVHSNGCVESVSRDGQSLPANLPGS
jgi:hypothetical protein